MIIDRCAIAAEAVPYGDALSPGPFTADNPPVRLEAVWQPTPWRLTW